MAIEIAADKLLVVTTCVQLGEIDVPILKLIVLQSVLKIMRPCAGLTSASLWLVVIRGISAPCVVELTSIIADESGCAPVAFMPIPCAFILEVVQIERPRIVIARSRDFFMRMFKMMVS